MSSSTNVSVRWFSIHQSSIHQSFIHLWIIYSSSYHLFINPSSTTQYTIMHLFIHPPIFSSIYPSVIIHLVTQPSAIEIIHPSIHPTFHQSPRHPSTHHLSIHHPSHWCLCCHRWPWCWCLWTVEESGGTPTRRTWELHIGQEHRIQPMTCWPWGELVSVEMCVGRHLRKHLPQSTVLTVWILQALTVRHSTCSNNSRTWAEPQQDQNRIVQVKHILDSIQSGFVVQQSASFEQNLGVVWTHIRTSLVEGEAGVLIATVSLFRAAGGVVLTAVAPDSWRWKTTGLEFTGPKLL